MSDLYRTEGIPPCPFCGGKAIMEQPGRAHLKIRCVDCPAVMGQKTRRLGLEWLENELLSLWSRRVPTKGVNY